MQIPIYQYEIDCRLAEKIITSTTMAFTCAITNIEQAKAQGDLLGKQYKIVEGAQAHTDQWDLFSFDSVLASIGWNKNDDVFDPGETILARNTPVNKWVNFMHNEKDIIGTTVASIIVTPDGKLIEEFDKVPDQYDIVTRDVLYRKWSDASLQSRMDNLIAEILDNKWAVSMECLFKNFDYAFITPTGEHKICPRTHTSAYLTKHLRVYGGTGEWQGNKVGRLLRNFSFSGKGIVNNPANPRSLILTDDVNPFKANSTIITIPEKTEEKTMADINDAVVSSLKDDLAKANARAERLEQKLNETVETARAAEHDKFQKQVAAQAVEIEELQKKNTTQAEELTKSQGLNLGWEKQMKEISEKLAASEKEVAASKLAQLKASRVSQLVSAQVNVEDATKIVEKWSTATDEQFADIVALHAKMSDKGGDADEEATKEAYKKAEKEKKAKAEAEAEAKKKADLEKAKKEAEAEAALAGTNSPEAAANVKAAAAWIEGVLHPKNEKKNEE